MSRFNLRATDKSPEEWSAIALQKASSSGTQFTTIGGIVLALWVGSSAGIIPGLIILAWSIYFNIEKAKNSSRNIDAISEEGCVAHTLKERDFNAYRRQVGDEKILEEIDYAILEGLPISEHSRKIHRELASSRKTLAIAPATEINNDGNNDSESDNSDKLLEQCLPCQNSIIIGLPGSGKGILVSNLIRKLKAANPNFGVYFIDPKASYREAGYWLEICDIYQRRNCENLDSGTAVNWVEEQFTAFNKWHESRGDKAESLLVLDEGWLIANKCQTAKSTIIKDKIVSLSSLGNDSGRHFWIMSQTPFMGALGLDLSTGASMLVYAIIKGGNVGTLRAWSRATAIAPLKAEDAKILLDNSPCDRIIYSGATGRWQSMPTLHNYSSFNRDTREEIVPHGELEKLKELWKKSSGTPQEFLEEFGCPEEMRERIIKEIEKW